MIAGQWRQGYYRRCHLLSFPRLCHCDAGEVLTFQTCFSSLLFSNHCILYQHDLFYRASDVPKYNIGRLYICYRRTVWMLYRKPGCQKLLRNFDIDNCIFCFLVFLIRMNCWQRMLGCPWWCLVVLVVGWLYQECSTGGLSANWRHVDQVTDGERSTTVNEGALRSQLCWKERM